jgi:hypothetical protein
MTSMMPAIGMSVVCGPCQLPQHRWKRIRSSGSPLQDQARVDNRLILLAHRVRAGPQHLIVVGVVLVPEAGAAARRHRVQEALGNARGRHRGLHVRDVPLHGFMALIGDRPAAHRGGLACPVGQRRAGTRVAVRLREGKPVPAAGEGGQHDLAGPGLGLRDLRQLQLDQLDAAEALEHVGPPRPVVVALAHRVAVLAVVDQVDAHLALARDHVRDRRAQVAQVLRLVGELPRRALAVQRNQVLGSRQAARVAGKDPVRHCLLLEIQTAMTLPAPSMSAP